VRGGKKKTRKSNKYTLEAEKKFKTCNVKKNRSHSRDSSVKWYFDLSLYTLL